jgi:phenylpropionate dioxygenase-like ring-hydroxylating dioxygenase large terminal subunit
VVVSSDVPIYFNNPNVNAAAYVDQSTFEIEMNEIWYKEWIYIGHESEVPEVGSFCRKQLGMKPVLLTRDVEGSINVFFNSCPHLGNMVCEKETGRSRTLRCPYHGWTFAPDGHLMGVPYPEGFGSSFVKGDHGLTRLPRVDSYGGFVFASLASDGPDLVSHLGNACTDIDQLCRMSPVGEIDLTAGWLKHEVKSNWKIAFENNIDGYHPTIVHRSMNPLEMTIFDSSTDKSVAQIRYLGNGSSDVYWVPEYRRLNKEYLWLGGVAPEKLQGYSDSLVAAYGPELAREIIVDGPPHTIIFPNLFIAELFVMVFQPLAVDRCLLLESPIQWKEAPVLNRRNILSTAASIGPAGMVLADDVAIFERNQAGLAAQEPAWIARIRGMDREVEEASGIISSSITDDTPHRGFWSHYQKVMNR